MMSFLEGYTGLYVVCILIGAGIGMYIAWGDEKVGGAWEGAGQCGGLGLLAAFIIHLILQTIEERKEAQRLEISRLIEIGTFGN